MNDTFDRGTDLRAVAREIVVFNAARKWEQFHDPKNLAMAVVSEAGELAALFRWISNCDSDGFANEHSEIIAEEIADVGILLLTLCHRLDVNLADVISRKITKNGARYRTEGGGDRDEP